MTADNRGALEEDLSKPKADYAVGWLSGRMAEWADENRRQHQPQRTNSVIVHAPHVVTVLAEIDRLRNANSYLANAVLLLQTGAENV